jgi:hypothetical protein
MIFISDLAEAMVEILNSHPEKDWPDAEVALDYVSILASTGLKVIVSPDLVQLTAEQSQGRKQFLNVHSVLLVHLIVGRSFEGLSAGNDVAPWSECKELLDVYQKTQRVLAFKWPERTRLINIEPQPVDEQQMDYRNFNVFTTFGYEVISK